MSTFSVGTQMWPDVGFTGCPLFKTQPRSAGASGLDKIKVEVAGYPRLEEKVTPSSEKVTHYQKTDGRISFPTCPLPQTHAAQKNKEVSLPAAPLHTPHPLLNPLGPHQSPSCHQVSLVLVPTAPILPS